MLRGTVPTSEYVGLGTKRVYCTECLQTVGAERATIVTKSHNDTGHFEIKPTVLQVAGGILMAWNVREREAARQKDRLDNW